MIVEQMKSLTTATSSGNMPSCATLSRNDFETPITSLTSCSMALTSSLTTATRRTGETTEDEVNHLVITATPSSSSYCLPLPTSKLYVPALPSPLRPESPTCVTALHHQAHQNRRVIPLPKTRLTVRLSSSSAFSLCQNKDTTPEDDDHTSTARTGPSLPPIVLSRRRLFSSTSATAAARTATSLSIPSLDELESRHRRRHGYVSSLHQHRTRQTHRLRLRPRSRQQQQDESPQVQHHQSCQQPPPQEQDWNQGDFPLPERRVRQRSSITLTPIAGAATPLPLPHLPLF